MKLPQGNSYRIIGDRFFSGHSGETEALSIRVVDGVVTERLPLESIPKDVSSENLLDLRGLVVLSPLMDTHVHVYMNPWPLSPSQRVDPGSEGFSKELEAAFCRMREAHAAGVGILRDLGDPMEINLAAANLASGDSSLPRLLAAGAACFREGRYGRFLGKPTRDLASLLDAIRAASADPRVHLIKLVPTGIINFKKGMVTTAPQFTADEFGPAVALAHDLGKKVAAHCSGEEGVRLAAEAGVDFIEHGYFIARDTLDLMAKKDLVWTPTFAPVHTQWHHSATCGWDGETRAHLRRILDGHAESLRYARSIGVRIMAGSDAGGVGVSHGGGVLLELGLMQEAGLRPVDLLQMATSQGPLWTGALPEHVFPACGSPADFIVGEPGVLTDVRKLASLRLVSRDGRLQEAKTPRMEGDAAAATYGVPAAQAQTASTHA